MDQIELTEKMKRQGINLCGDLSIQGKALEWERAVKLVLKPKDISDRTCIHNISNWLIKQCENDRFDDTVIFRRVLDFALESSGPKCRNPFAVFMSILKKEIGYLKE